MLASIVRTFVPLVVGLLLSLPVVQRLGVSEDQATQVVTAVVTGLYYVLARLAEHYLSPNFGWLLGYPQAPTYAKPEQ